ncbi:MAG: hypothetical protein IPK35_10565 [Saprospiraceae bacterium]|nr:hypothetical protein [Saprospiraceae bacterium]
MPALADIQDKYRYHGLKVVSISLDGSAATDKWKKSSKKKICTGTITSCMKVLIRIYAASSISSPYHIISSLILKAASCSKMPQDLRPDAP